jgi:hypothetical protein
MLFPGWQKGRDAPAASWSGGSLCFLSGCPRGCNISYSSSPSPTFRNTVTSIVADPDSTGPKNPKTGKNKGLEELSGGLKTSHGAWTSFIEVLEEFCPIFLSPKKSAHFQFLLDPDSANLDPNLDKEKKPWIRIPTTLEIS